MSQHFSYQYSLFPNTALTFDSRHVELWQILPVAADASEVVHTAYLRPGLSDEERSKVVDMAPWICEKVVDGEDFWVAGPDRARRQDRPARHGGVRTQRARPPAPAPGVRRRPGRGRRAPQPPDNERRHCGPAAA